MDSGGKGKGRFEGTCNHCGKYGHRKRECRALDAEMAMLRGLNHVDGRRRRRGERGPAG